MKINFTLLFILFISLNSFGQWENLNTGINDNLNGVVFFQQNGLVSGENGLYYTTNGGQGSSSWTEFHIPANTSSAIFEDTKFSHCYGVKTNTTSTGIIYACGQTVNDSRAVLFKINIPSMTCELIYQGVVNTKLNKIDCVDYDNINYAVGDNGKILNFTNSGSLIEVISNTTDNLVSVASSNNRIVYGSENKIWTASVFGSSLSDFGNVQSSAINVKDFYGSGSIAYVTGGDKLNNVYFNNSASLSSNKNFTTPLNANAIIYTNKIFVGTENGIYQYIFNSNFQNGSLELQPSSLNYQINEFWFQNSGTYTYACGNNGVLLRTSNEGGATIPFVRMSATGTCVNGTVQFTAITGSGNSAKWYIDNVLSSTSLTGFNHTFNTAGQYLIGLEVKNSFNETTTVSQYINIVPVPAIDKPITISDVILCKAEAIQISIDNSEPNVKYILRKDGSSDSNFGETQAGNGGIVVLNSELIDVTGNYYIDAVSTLANCSRRFNANFLITVEETKAEFHSGAINAYINEPISYFNQSFDAQNFDWQFVSASGTQYSNSLNPQNSYSAPGQVTVNLDASSNNNCHDIVTKNGAMILDPVSNPSDCMLLVNNGLDLPHDGRDDRDDISQMSPTTDGFITCGAYNNVIFDSKYGVTLNLQNKQGGYVTKHDKNGVLKWVVYTTANYNGIVNKSNFTSCVEDLEGNIYISGFSDGNFHDNSGKVISLGYATDPSYVDLNDFIIKLNSKGEFIWRIQTRAMGFAKLSIDKENNVVVNTEFPYSPTVGIFFNGFFVKDLDYDYPYGFSGIYKQYNVRGLLKIDPSGTILWNAKIISDSVNGFNSNVIGFDNLNNIYVSSSCESGVDLYSVNNSVKSISDDGTYGGKFAIAKYDSAGNCSWAIRSRTTSTIPDNTDGTSIYGFAVDDAGNSYISGKNGCIPNSTQYTHVFENADGTVTKTTNGTYFIARVNTNGICEWIRSTTTKVYGDTNQLFKRTNQLYVLGHISTENSSIPVATAEFESSDNKNYTLSINNNNYFIAVYDLDGNLKKIFANTDYENTSLLMGGVRGFFMDSDDNFYVAKNMGYVDNNSVDFGNIIPALNGMDGTIVKFKESCGVLKYDASSPLSLNQNLLDETSLVLYPNPTLNEFKIDLKQKFNEITLEVYDINGKLIRKQKYQDCSEIISKIDGSSGMYFLKLKDQKNHKWLKLIKK